MTRGRARRAHGPGPTRAALAIAIAVLGLAPGAWASLPVDLRFDGRPFEPTAPPEISCFDTTRSRWTNCPAVKGVAPGEYLLERPAPGTYRMHVSIDENPANPRRYPGDYEAQLRFEVTATGPERLTVDLPRLIHLRQPGDNGRSLEGMLMGCVTQPRFETARYAWSPAAHVAFAWAPIVDGAEYRYHLTGHACAGAGAPRKVAGGTTTALELALVLPPSAEGEHYVFRIEAWKQGRLVGDLYTHDAGTHSWNYRFRVLDASQPRWLYLLAAAAILLLIAGMYRGLVRIDRVRRRILARRLAWGALAAVVVAALAVAGYQYREDRDRRRAEAARAAADAVRASRHREFVAAFASAAPRPDWWDRVDTPYRVDSVGALLSAWQGHPRGDEGERKLFKAAYQGVVDHPDDAHLVATALSLLPWVVRDYPHHLGLARFGYERYFSHRARTDNCANCMVGDTTQGLVLHLSRLLTGAGRHDEAIAACRRLIDERGAEVSPYKLAETWNQMAWAHWEKGDRTRAVDTAREGLARHGNTVRSDDLRRTLARFEQEPPPAAPRPTDALPRPGSRVRIQARTLDPGWHEGMFNRQRVEPPCYLVLIFKPRATPTAPMDVHTTVPAEAIAALEAFAGPAPPAPEWIGRPSPETTSDRWRLVPIDVLREANAGCPQNAPAPK